jgi:hypothetical protein
LSPHCESGNAEPYPELSDRQDYPLSLRHTLSLALPSSMYEESEMLHGCCIDNEITVTATGQISHAVHQKGCDNRSGRRV